MAFAAVSVRPGKPFANIRPHIAFQGIRPKLNRTAYIVSGIFQQISQNEENVHFFFHFY